MEALIASTGPDGFLDCSATLGPGAEVRLIAGPFAEMIGVLERLDPAGRARVLLTIMGGEVAVSVPAKSLVAA